MGRGHSHLNRPYPLDAYNGASTLHLWCSIDAFSTMGSQHRFNWFLIAYGVRFIEPTPTPLYLLTRGMGWAHLAVKRKEVPEGFVTAEPRGHWSSRRS